MAKPLAELLQKELSRKEFLALVGFGAASVFGFSTVLRLLGYKPASLTSPIAKTDSGYGSSPYGGKTN